MRLIGTGYKTLTRISDGVSSVILELTNDSQVIPVGETGENYTYAQTTANLYEGNKLVTSNIIYQITEIGQITGEWNELTRTYTVVNMFEDMGKVNIKATYKDVDYEANFILTKVYNGEDTVFIDLTNDRHIFASDFNGSMITEESITTEMIAYKGSEIIPLTKVQIPAEPIPGLLLEVIAEQTVKITALVGDALAFAGGFDITGRIGYQGYKKQFRWVKIMNGEPGMPGEDGLPGTPGVDGQTSYFHVKYSPVENPTPEQMTETVGDYIGTYVDFTEADSTDPTKYTWVKIKGMDGENGIPGINGVDGSTSYLHIKYAPVISPTSAQMTETPDIFIGTYTDFILEDSTDPSFYSWARFRGYDGEQGQTGPQGPPGADGKPGEQGPPGPILDWVQDWDDSKVYIGDTKIITPRLFAGSLDASFNPTGVAIGQDVFGTTGGYAGVSGIAGYKNGVKMYHLTTDGNFLVGDELGSHLKFDGETFSINASAINIGVGKVPTDEEVSSNINSSIGAANKDLMETIEQNYATQGNLNEVKTDLSSLASLTEERFSLSFSETISRVDSVNGDLQGFKDTVTTQIDFSQDGMLMGKSDSPFQMRLNETKLAFLENGEEIAYVSNNKLFITQAEVKQDLVIGSHSSGAFSWHQGASGNLSLKWIGR